MAELGPVFMVSTLVLIMPWLLQLNCLLVNGHPPEVNWATTRETRKGSITNLQFFFHDTVSGKNPSAIRVAQASTTNKSATLFGAVLMADDPLTVGPDPKSKLLGRARGLYGSSGQYQLALIMAMNFCFLDGAYNGSCISILGRNEALNPEREIAVVGGTGRFRMARGYATARTHWFDMRTGDAIVKYDVTIAH